MESNWNSDLRAQLEFHWTQQLRPRLDGLTDDEYFWEPVPDAWSVRKRDDGTYSCDWAYPAPPPPPFTTIAWRLAHISVMVLGLRVASHFGDAPLNLERYNWPGSAVEALAVLDKNYAAWIAGVQSLGEDGLLQSIGETEGPFSEYPFSALVLHINREVIHHGAEIALLRDLYRDRASLQVG